MLVCGVDEAGRGCIIGPLVICGVLLEEEDIPRLVSLGVKDSKLLSEKARERIEKELKSFVKYSIVVISPKDVDKSVLSKEGDNLNWLEAVKTAEIINSLKPDVAFVDCPSNNVKAYNSFLVSKVKGKVDIRTEHKADMKYAIVGAASIIAKVARDNEIKSIKKNINVDFGSGYMSDAKTAEFLKKNWSKYPEI